jgi:3-deoxy-D-manno-octulosonic-acid transferase
MNFPSAVTAAIGVYRLAWRILLPFLRFNKRLAKGWDQRRLTPPLPQADLWLQAASAGEAYLAREIISTLNPPNPIRVLVTTNTGQGLKILTSTGVNSGATSENVKMVARYIPFDDPKLMKSAIASVRPRLIGLLETELWPGLLAASKTTGTPVMVINGRINPSSLKRYMTWPALWRTLAPEQVLSISAQDARRFGCLFPDTSISVMDNIKFDQWYRLVGENNASHLASLFEPDPLFVVFGSIRQEEEASVKAMLSQIHQRVPEAIFAIFPRHMNRLDTWQAYLNQNQSAWCLRSEIKTGVPPGHIVLWDTFGELRDAYALAATAFVGGSLAPLGGQNFLEPLAGGVLPVIGPSWHNFAWVGEAIFNQKLVYRASDWREAADHMAKALEKPVLRESVHERVRRYAQKNIGGTGQACRIIESYLMTSR